MSVIFLFSVAHSFPKLVHLHIQQPIGPTSCCEPFNLEDPFENPPTSSPTPMDVRRIPWLIARSTHRGFEDAIVVPEINANFELSMRVFNFLDKMPRDCLRIIESKSKVRNSRNKPVVAKVSASTSTPGISSEVAELKEMVKALLLDKKNQSPALSPCQAATSGNVYRDNIQEYVSQAAAANYNQGNTGYRAPISNQIRPPGFPPVQNNHMQNQGNNQNRYNQNRGNFNQAPAYQSPVHQGQVYHDLCYVKANDAVMRNMQTQGQNMQNQLNNLATSNQRLESMLGNFIKMNTASTSGTLPSNTVTNPKEDLKGITTRSGVAYKGPTIHTTSSPKVVEREPEVTKDHDASIITEAPKTSHLRLSLLSIMNQSLSPQMLQLVLQGLTKKHQIPYLPSRRNDERRREKANDQIEKFYEIFWDLSFEISFTDALMLMPKFASTLKTLIGNKEKEAITFNLDQTSRYTANYNHMTANRIDVIDMACEEYSQEVLGFSDVISSGNPTPYYDPIVSTVSPTLTPFGDSDFLLFEEADSFLALEDDPTSPEVDPTYYDPEGDILLLEAILNSEPSPPLQGNYFPETRKDLKICEANNEKSSVFVAP
ncbi:hypothetical protein Tco_0033170 [Tanacetum coccineum]